jgi:hypothetical protein
MAKSRIQYVFVLWLAWTGGCAHGSGSESSETNQVMGSEPAPSPLEGKSTREICLDDGLLLSQYDIETLFGTPLPAPCCAAGILPEDDAWRCTLDWPSSDVPPCVIWKSLERRLLASYGYPFPDFGLREKLLTMRGYQVRSDFEMGWLNAHAQKNIEVLKKWWKENYSCEPTEGFPALNP